MADRLARWISVFFDSSVLSLPIFLAFGWIEAGTLGLLWFRWARSTPLPGSTFLLFAALSSGWRLFIEAFRGDSTFILSGLRLAQVSALAMLAVSLYLLEVRIKSQPAHAT